MSVSNASCAGQGDWKPLIFGPLDRAVAGGRHATRGICKGISGSGRWRCGTAGFDGCVWEQQHYRKQLVVGQQVVRSAGEGGLEGDGRQGDPDLDCSWTSG